MLYLCLNTLTLIGCTKQTQLMPEATHKVSIKEITTVFQLQRIEKKLIC